MSKKIIIFAPYFEYVGTEKVMVTLANGFALKGHDVHLIRTCNEWKKAAIDKRVKLIDLKSDFLIKVMPFKIKYKLWNILLSIIIIPKLAAYIKREKPDIILAGLMSVNAVIANLLTGSKAKVVVTVQGLPRPSWLRNIIWNIFYKKACALVYPAGEMSKNIPDKVKKKVLQRTIFNPVIDRSIQELSNQYIDHKWLNNKTVPVILGVGRLTYQKDFETLLKAFALVRKKINCKLIILGEGHLRFSLSEKAKQAGIFEDVDMPGFTQNPFSYMKKADVFVLSSKWEGPGHVYIEAMGVATPVVSTNCPYGPAEVLNDGQIAPLVEVGNHKAMASEIYRILNDRSYCQKLSKACFERSRDFMPEKIVSEYCQLFCELI